MCRLSPHCDRRASRNHRKEDWGTVSGITVVGEAPPIAVGSAACSYLGWPGAVFVNGVTSNTSWSISNSCGGLSIQTRVSRDLSSSAHSCSFTAHVEHATASGLADSDNDVFDDPEHLASHIGASRKLS